MGERPSKIRKTGRETSDFKNNSFYLFIFLHFVFLQFPHRKMTMVYYDTAVCSWVVSE